MKEIARYVMPAEKERTNQPPTFSRSGSYLDSLFRTDIHDYVYLPEDYEDERSGKSFKRGYYDEKGMYYKRIIIEKGNTYETRATCRFCGTQIKLKWEKDALPACPNCGAALQEILEDSKIEKALDAIREQVLVPAGEDEESLHYVNGQRVRNAKVPSNETYVYGSRPRSHRLGWLEVIPYAGLLVLILGVGCILTFCGFKKRQNSAARTLSAEEQAAYYEHMKTATPTPSPTPKPTPIPGYVVKFVASEDFSDTIYVSAIGRECHWHSSGNYYDSVTDCYFWLNTNVYPAIWQYWYEGISSDFGDFGWMEYDFEENQWYIEESKGKWIVLPDKYDQSKLWHMTFSDDGRYKGYDSIYVHEIGRVCKYIESEKNYYDPVTLCHFYYDTYTSNGTWCYWYENLNSESGIGWMKYNMGEKSWYVENRTRWVKVDLSGYKQTRFWHIEKDPIEEE
ncbi:MAG: hypothetical protein J5752_02160 [Clostridiales bacterium]|nr:hypothetical protein [Clostridiales bacterium]